MTNESKEALKRRIKIATAAILLTGVKSVLENGYDEADPEGLVQTVEADRKILMQTIDQVLELLK